MPPILALVIGYGLVFWLIRMDMRWRELSSPALWIPGLYLCTAGSRQLSFWLGIGGDSNLEGSPVNVLYNGTLICASIIVLARRQFNWSTFVTRNKALILIYFFFVISALWSDFPFATTKRVVNDFLCVLAALVILTDKEPGLALRTVFVRVACLLLPMSVVAIRYFPAVGRQFSHSWEYMYTGVTGHKNSLGELTMVLGLLILWDMLESSGHSPSPETKIQRWCRIGVLLVCLYLLIICDSATALICFIVGAILLLLLKRLARMRNARQLLLVSFAALIGLVAIDKAFGISDIVLKALGRDSTLTGRTEIWTLIHEKNTNVLLGSGFRGFWESQAGESVYEDLNLNRLLTAHNGYLDVYLYGGVPGIGLLIILLFSMGREAISKLLEGAPLGKIALAFWFIALIHNMSESSFFIETPLWITLLIVTMDCRNLCPASASAVPAKAEDYAPSLAGT